MEKPAVARTRPATKERKLASARLLLKWAKILRRPSRECRSAWSRVGSRTRAKSTMDAAAITPAAV